MIRFHLGFIQVSLGPTMTSLFSNFVYLTLALLKLYGFYLQGLKGHFGLYSPLFLSIRPSISSVLLTLKIFLVRSVVSGLHHYNFKKFHTEFILGQCICLSFYWIWLKCEVLLPWWYLFSFSHFPHSACVFLGNNQNFSQLFL